MIPKLKETKTQKHVELEGRQGGQEELDLDESEKI